MSGRKLALTLAAWGCGLASTTCFAQGYSSAGGVVTLPASAGGYEYSSGAFGDGPGWGGASPAGYAEGGAYCPPGAGYGQVPCPPNPEPWWKCRPLFTVPKPMKPPRGAFFRTEYLLWEIQEPGSVFLGAHVTPDEVSQIVPFPATDNTTSDGYPLEQGGFGYTPNIDEIQLRDNSGLRLTLGIPTYDYGTIELSAWMLEQASDSFEFVPRELFPGVPFVPTQPLKTDGVSPSNVGNSPDGIYRVYDSLDAEYSSDMWGADAKFVVDALAPQGEGFKLKPLFGFKYIDFQEAFYQRGRLDGQGFFPSFNSSVNSSTSNNIFGGTIGLRAELEHRWFILGAQPAVTFAGNVARTRVVTDRFLGESDPYTESSSDYFDFSPVLDLSLYARICLSENLRLNVGYDAFWLSRLYRPSRVIEYNVSTANGGLATDFSTKREDDSVAVEGLSVGLEYIF